ncbi:MAG: TVP38/TMEM64 family protein [Geodermatophilaceae bacterium]|nr:TVP38/TMEM64 family protein [Geodermatophilaceae bacterium]
MRGRWWIRPLILLIVVIAGVAVALTIDIPSVDELRVTVAKVGWSGPVLYAVAYAGLVLTPLPATISTITAGILFGLPVGLAVSLAGAVVGASIGFGLSRVLGRGAVERLDSDRLHRLDDLLRRRGLIAVIGIRLVPLLPFAALNYACGLSAVRPRDFVLGTAIGILPVAAAYSTIGAFGASPGSLPFLVALGGLGALTIGGVIVIRRRHKLATQPRT